RGPQDRPCEHQRTADRSEREQRREVVMEPAETAEALRVCPSEKRQPREEGRVQGPRCEKERRGDPKKRGPGPPGGEPGRGGDNDGGEVRDSQARRRPHERVPGERAHFA